MYSVRTEKTRYGGVRPFSRDGLGDAKNVQDNLMPTVQRTHAGGKRVCWCMKMSGIMTVHRPTTSFMRQGCEPRFILLVLGLPAPFICEASTKNASTMQLKKTVSSPGNAPRCSLSYSNRRTVQSENIFECIMRNTIFLFQIKTA